MGVLELVLPPVAAVLAWAVTPPRLRWPRHRPVNRVQEARRRQAGWRARCFRLTCLSCSAPCWRCFWLWRCWQLRACMELDSCCWVTGCAGRRAPSPQLWRSCCRPRARWLWRRRRRRCLHRQWSSCREIRRAVAPCARDGSGCLPVRLAMGVSRVMSTRARALVRITYRRRGLASPLRLALHLSKAARGVWLTAAVTQVLCTAATGPGLWTWMQTSMLELTWLRTTFTTPTNPVAVVLQPTAAVAALLLSLPLPTALAIIRPRPRRRRRRRRRCCHISQNIQAMTAKTLAFRTTAWEVQPQTSAPAL